MSVESGDRFMAATFMQPPAEGTEMPLWRQHMTVFPWANGNLDATLLSLEETARELLPIDAKVIDTTHFGANEMSFVFLLDPKDTLKSMHRAIISTLHRTAELEDVTYTGDSYIPHITDKREDPELKIGDKIYINSFSIVHEICDKRKILKHFQLGA